MKLSLKIFPALGAAAVVLSGVAACSSSGCLENHSAIPRAEFCNAETGKSQAFTGLEISGVGAPNDSLLITRNQSVTDFYLPMRSSHTSTEWCIHYVREGISGPEFNDTIRFDYTSQPYFASEDCGAMYTYRIDRMRYTTHVLDSVAITDSLITNVDIVRIRIFMPELPPVETDTPDNPEDPDNPDEGDGGDNPDTNE